MTDHATFLQTLQALPKFWEFDNWYLDNENYDILAPYYTGILPFNRLPESFQLAALVDYFDSKGVYINTNRGYTGNWWADIDPQDDSAGFTSSRPDAIRAGILKAITLI